MAKDYLFQKGNTAAKGKVGKKYPNPLKTKLKAIVDGYVNSDSFVDDLQQMEPVERFKAYASIIPYVLPKKRELSINELSDDLAEDLLDQILTENE